MNSREKKSSSPIQVSFNSACMRQVAYQSLEAPGHGAQHLFHLGRRHRANCFTTRALTRSTQTLPSSTYSQDVIKLHNCKFVVVCTLRSLQNSIGRRKLRKNQTRHRDSFQDHLDQDVRPHLKSLGKVAFRRHKSCTGSPTQPAIHKQCKLCVCVLVPHSRLDGQNVSQVECVTRQDSRDVFSHFPRGRPRVVHLVFTPARDAWRAGKKPRTAVAWEHIRPD